ncbi:hypothetical protein [Noviherbaspirillum sp.]|mgnify:CR=1 FL=1|uniref:hypothetical protein n=1 Tax=Noviherbaspirillum sp. TaxID=1926288 RepID=UPI002FDFA923
MAFKPPLTREKLVEIQERNKDCDDVLALLWEIKRLRAIVLRADQLQRSIPNPGTTTQIIIDALRSELKGEPCIEEERKIL